MSFLVISPPNFTNNWIKEFYIAYRDITSRVSQTQDTGTMEIQNLSTQLQDKFD